LGNPAESQINMAETHLILTAHICTGLNVIREADILTLKQPILMGTLKPHSNGPLQQYRDWYTGR